MAGVLALLALLLLGMPIGVALGLVGIGGLVLTLGLEPALIKSGVILFETLSRYELGTLPLFLLMAHLCFAAGASRDFFDAAARFLGHRRGGLAYASVAGCAGFGSINGSSLATTATIGLVALPEMRSRGYSDSLATGVLAAGGTLGQMIPPSGALIVFGIVAQQSIGALFTAAIVPGITQALSYLLVIMLIVRVRPRSAPATERSGWPARWAAVKRVGDLGLLIVLVIGGIMMGWFTPSEAASLGAAWAIAICAWRRRLSWAVLGTALYDTLKTSGLVYTVIVGALIFSAFISVTGLTDAIANQIVELGAGPLSTMVLIAVFLLLLGSVLDGLAADAADNAHPAAGSDADGPFASLVRHLPGACDGDRLRASAAGDEPVCNPRRGQGRPDDAHLPRRAALPGRGSAASAAVDPVPGPRAGAPALGASMSGLEQSVDRILADPLRAAGTDGRALGYVGTDVPLDLLLATGRVACHLPWTPDRATPLADQWLESSFPGWARSMIEDWAAGRFDCFAEVIFSRGGDATQRLYYYLCELQRRGQIGGPQPLIFDIAMIPRESSLRHTVAAVRRLATRLDVSDAGLESGIRRANARRALFERIESSRHCRGSLYEKIARASLFEDLDAMLENADWPMEQATGRVLLAGSAPPDDRLHRAVERTGWSVTGEMNELALARLGPQVAMGPDPAEAIGRQRHASPFGTSRVWRCGSGPRRRSPACPGRGSAVVADARGRGAGLESPRAACATGCRPDTCARDDRATLGWK